MASPHTDAWHVEVDVLSGSEIPRLRHPECDSHCIARQSLDFGFCAAFPAEVVSHEEVKSREALEDPANKCPKHQDLCGPVVEMDPNRRHGSDHKSYVQVQESLVKCMADDGWGLEENGAECSKSNRTTQDELTARHGLAYGNGCLFHSQSLNLLYKPESGVSNSLEHHDAANPPVKEVEVVERNVHEPDHGIVTPCKQKERYHVEHCEHSGTTEALVHEGLGI